MILSALIGEARALTCDTSGYDSDLDRHPCEILALTPGPDECLVEGGRVTVITTDGCEDLVLILDGAFVEATSVSRTEGTPTAHRTAWHYPLAEVASGDRVVHVRERWHPQSLAQATLDLGTGSIGDLKGEVGLVRAVIEREEPCDTRSCCTDEEDIRLEWIAPAASQPGWTAQVFDGNGRFFDATVLGGDEQSRITFLEGQPGDAPSCVAVHVFDALGAEHGTTPCVATTRACGCGTGSGPVVLAWIGLLVMQGRRFIRV